jgi:hypothetical protein
MKAKWFKIFSVVTLVAMIAGTVFYIHDRNEPKLRFAKGDPDAPTIEMTVGNGNEKGPTSEAEAEFAERAYPADDIPFDLTLNAQAAFNQIKAKGVGKGKNILGQWTLAGPSTANFPGLLAFSGADYTTSGRITALAIAPGCTTNGCRLWVGAAGGGVWRTDNALSGNGANWKYVSGSFVTNAIGSLLVDPNDPTGKTIYAGTGEPNVSSDSEAGMGIYRSTNGGDSWTLLPGSSQFQGRAVSSLAVTPSGEILAGIARAVRGVSSVTGGATSNPPTAVTFGVYKSSDGGTTFTNVSTALGSARGVTEVEVDPNNSSIYYAAFLGEGVWRSVDAGATWTQVKNPLNTPNNANNTDRSDFALANNNGTTRMYVGQGASGGPQARFYRTDNAQTASNADFIDLTTAQNIDYCTGQCWYDNVVVSPAGHPDIVYVLGSYQYGEYGWKSNSRSVLLSTDAGQTFSDVSWDANTPPNGIHPDQHALVVSDSNPFLFFEGSDGGLMRSSGEFTDQSAQCEARGLIGSNLAFCQGLLWRIPTQLYSLNKGLSTLQFQSLSVNPFNAKNVMGGTQDNGTFETTGSAVVWPQIIYGDGGQSGFSSGNGAMRFNSFFGQNHDANFQNGDPTKWVIISGKIASSPEGSNFYAPIIADPNPAAAGTIFEGSQSVWRTQDWGGDQAYLEANCPEFTTSGADPNCGDFVRIGPAGATDLTANALDYRSGSSRAGGFVAAIERTKSDTGTLWVATTTGRVFISKNADAAAGSVTYTRLDTLASNDPQRFVSGIYVDPANPNHAWISYSGYNFNTPAQPGHIFEVTYNQGAGTATWTDISYNVGDLPATDIVRDDVTGDLYASSDFGVMRLAAGQTTWYVAGTGLPNVEVAGLTIVPGSRILYAATHGRSAWMLKLP